MSKSRKETRSAGKNGRKKIVDVGSSRPKCGAFRRRFDGDEELRAAGIEPVDVYMERHAH